jgi:hypothetical protein
LWGFSEKQSKEEQKKRPLKRFQKESKLTVEAKMGDKLGDSDTTKKQQPPPPPQQQISSSHKDPLEESTETREQQQRHHSPPNVTPFYVPSEQQFEAMNPKRPRYTG